jgi:hypothetical protein
MHWRRPDERMVREARRSSPGIVASEHLPLPVIGLDRSLEAIPNSEPPDHAVHISAVRVECWRLRLESTTAALHGEKLREATAEATP